MSIGAIGSRTSRVSRSLQSINLRPDISGPSSSPSGTQTSGQGGSQSSTPGSGSTPSQSNQNGEASGPGTSRSGTGPTSTLNPASRASVIGNRPAPPEAGQGNQPIGGDGSRARPPTESASPNESRNPSELSPAERRELQELKRIDAKVRAHEQAHLAAAGQYAQGGISYQTKTGPDGQEYAVAGEVSLDTSEAETPEQTIQKMRQVKAAALAPANPSAQDRQIASQAAQKLSEAQLEKAQNRGGESPENNDSGSTENASGEGNSRSQGTSTGYERPDEFGAGSPGEDGPGVYSEAGRPDGNDRSNKISQFITEPSPTGGQPSSGRALNLLA